MSKRDPKRVINDEVRELVVARLRSLSSNKKISIGSGGEFDKNELIERVEKNDEIGKKIIEIQLQYLRSLKEGVFLPQ